MNLRRLDYFCQLAQHGNFTRAASQIGIAQPALSISIQKLEQELELKLINRAEKNAILTAEGKVLYSLAIKLLSQANQIKVELAELKNLSRGSIRFGVSAMLGSYYFPQKLTEFKQKYPNIKIQLIDQGTAKLEQMLLDGTLDIALLRCDTESDSLRYVELIEEEVFAAMATNNYLAKEPSITLDQFCQQQLILFHQGYYLREAVSEYSRKNRVKLDIKMETNLIELQKSLVRNEVGITTCLRRILEGETHIAAISFKPKIKFKLGLAWKKNHYLSNASRALIDFLKE